MNNYSTIPLAIALLGILASEAFGIQKVHEVEKDKPNILFILIDDLGHEVLKSYGGSSYETPNIDKISQHSIRLKMFMLLQYFIHQGSH